MRKPTRIVRDGWHTELPHPPLIPTSVRRILIVFSLWMLAFLLKHAGASWDVAWHYQFVRDDLIPPHLLNLLGNGLALTLLAIQVRTNIAVERRGLIVLLSGFAMFIIALPLDLLNHRLFGLDVTIWSAPHLLFFAGSTVALIGLLSIMSRPNDLDGISVRAMLKLSNPLR